MAEHPDVQDALKSMRHRIEELEGRRVRSAEELRLTAVAAALAVGLVALTATSWVVDRDDNEPYTLWGLVPEGWQAFVMLALVAGTAIATTQLFLSDRPSRLGHLLLVWLSLLTAIWVIALNSMLPDEALNAPSRWLTLLAALAIATTHGFRAEEIRRSP